MSQTLTLKRGTPTSSDTTMSLMTEIVSYPVLLQHEEALTKKGSNMYDVSSWMLYLNECDALLSQTIEHLTSSIKQTRNRGPLSMQSYEVGGRKLKPTELLTSFKTLQQARNLISERALSLLPGSYKLWKDYLHFRSHIYIPSMIQFLEQHKSPNEIRPFHYHSKTYRTTISAFERALVRMNKYPRIWLMYLHYTILNSPPADGEITHIRRLFNRALLALPATQHELIWSEYLCWILRQVPAKSIIGAKMGPLVQSCKSGVFPRRQTISESKEEEDDRGSYVGLEPELPSETILRILRRYANSFNPMARELLAKVALSYNRFGEAASLYRDLLEDSDFLSGEGTTRHELWIQLADICTEHPADVKAAGVDFEGIVRAVIKPEERNVGWEAFEKEQQSTNDNDQERAKNEERRNKVQEQQHQLQASLGEMEGTLWTKLAHYHIRSGEFEVARSIYEEAMESVSRVRDFSLIFDGYIKFEEGVIEAMMEMMDDSEDDEEDMSQSESKLSDEDNDEDLDILLGDEHKSKAQQNHDDDENTSADIELALARAEQLTSRRPVLLNYVLLRQNPHNVGEWLKRSELYLKSSQPTQAVAALEEAVIVLNSRKAVNGSAADLYKALAALHENELDQKVEARNVYKRICSLKPEYNFRESDELAQCYTAWVEFELRCENWDDALSVIRRSVARIPAAMSTKVTRGLVKCMRLWNLLFDLEESLGTIQTTKDAYNRAIELKVVTPSHILNLTSYLEENKYFEESFSAYERGVDLFPFPHPGAKLLWKEYLEDFEKRFAGTKTHRMRELFDRCLETCPADDASGIFIAYGKFEEKFGLTKRALGVYERMCTIVPSDEKYNAYELYIAKTVRYIGVTATRPIYERAIAALQDTPAANMCSDFAKMEASLQEFDRARTAYTYGAQLADPRRNPEYWGEWHEFEVSHGNEETFREMLRVKRGVQAAFSTVNYNAAGMGDAPETKNLTNEEALEMIAEREGVELNENEKVSGFVQQKRQSEVTNLDEVERRAAKLRKVTAGIVSASDNREENNGDDEIDLDDDDGDDEIDLDDDDGDEDEEEHTKQVTNQNTGLHGVSTKAIPSAVFGKLASQRTSEVPSK